MAKDIVWENGAGITDGDDGEKMPFFPKSSGPKPVSDAQRKWIREIRRNNPLAPKFEGKTFDEAYEYISKWRYYE